MNSTFSSGNVFLLLTDKVSEPVFRAYDTIKDATSPIGESCLLYHQKNNDLDSRLNRPDAFIFTNDSLMEMNYMPIASSLVPGSNHFAVLKFHLNNPGYEYYWFIEDDVRFNGNWLHFFNSFKDNRHDFITCHLRWYTQEPEWYWYITLRHAKMAVPLQECIRSFNPVYRISRRALSFIHQALADGWTGHHEVLLPTLLYRNGYSIMDFGGEGDFVMAGNENRFYTSGTPHLNGDLKDGTMRFRPAWNAVGADMNKLYHPIKEV
jgi:hypothetical protein